MNIEPKEQDIVEAVLKQYIPGYTVLAFGSRVHGEGLKKFSDLDLAVMTQTPLPLETLGDLKDAFTHSRLPFRVDVVDWASLSDAFRERILAASETIREGDKEETSHA